MADINKRLLTSSDGIPAPQHKVKGASDFEFTEGSSGAQHTKIVDSSGQPISIDEELKSIKRTQAEILDRLDNGIDTRVTGSNDEYVMPVKESSKNQEVITVYENFECPSGTVKILDHYDVGDFKDLFLQVTPGGLEDYRLFYYIRRNNRDTVLGREVASDRNNSQNFVSDRMQVNSNGMAVAVENRTESDHKFREIVFVGVRR